jgi:hypothetical protein
VAADRQLQFRLSNQGLADKAEFAFAAPVANGWEKTRGARG